MNMPRSLRTLCCLVGFLGLTLSAYSQSLYIDVNGDGLKDEVPKAGTADFNYSIAWWWTTQPGGSGLQVNTFWLSRTIFNPGEGLYFNAHVNFWFGASYFSPSYTTNFGVAFNIAPRPGRKMSIFMDPTGSTTANPANWQAMQLNMGPIAVPLFSYTQPFSTAGNLNNANFFVAHLAAPADPWADVDENGVGTLGCVCKMVEPVVSAGVRTGPCSVQIVG